MKNVFFIRASAGSGKTYQLSSHLIGLLLREPPEDPAGLLATTFTRAAAGEILARVMTRLSHAVLSDSERDQLSSDLGVSVTEKQCCEALERLSGNLHRLNIGTIDSFFARVARSLPDLVLLPRNWTVISEEKDLNLSAEVLAGLVAGPEAKILKRAWQDWRSPKRRIQNREDLLSVLIAIRFRKLGTLTASSSADFLSHNQAAHWSELVQTLPGQLNKADKKGHQAPNKIFEKRRSILLALLTTGTAFEVLVRESRIVQDLVSGGPDALPSGWALALHDLSIAARSAILAAYARRQNALSLLRDLYVPARKAATLAAGGVTFAEIEEAVGGAISWEEGGAAEDLVFHLDARISHLLIDEFQDTSRKQFEFFRPVIDEIVAQPDRTAYVVGDPKQAIYGWRGSDPEVIGGLESLIPNSSLSVKSLSISYRSSPAIMEAVNQVFQGMETVNSDNLGGSVFAESAQQWMTGFTPHSAYHKDLAGAARLWCLAKEDDPTEFLVNRTRELLSLAIPPKEIAILFRRAKEIPSTIDALRRAGIEAAPGSSGSVLTDSLAVEMILAGLVYLDHPHHKSAAAFLCSEASWGHHLKSEKPKDLLRAWQRQWENDGAAGLVASWVFESQFQAALSMHDKARCGQVLHLARQFDIAGGGRPSALVASIRTARISAGRPAPVRVMTIHASKGLEYDAVILGDLGHSGKRPDAAPDFVRDDDSEDEFWVEPHKDVAEVIDQGRRRNRNAGRSVAEELSLLYVGMTRARQTLDMVITKRGSSSKSFTKSSLLELVLAPDAAPSREVPAWMTEHQGTSNRESPRTIVPEDPIFKIVKAPAKSLAKRQPLLDRKSPSSQEGGDEVTIAKRFGGSGGRGMAVGTAIHAWLAAVEWVGDLSRISLDDLLEKTASDWVGMERTIAESLLAEMMEKLAGKHASLARAFDPEAFSISWQVPLESIGVWRERAFVVPMETTLWNGRFDRVVVAQDNSGMISHAEIIDFKSDTVPSDASLAEKQEFYKPQLESYKKILAHALRHQIVKPVISTSLIFTGWSG